MNVTVYTCWDLRSTIAWWMIRTRTTSRWPLLLACMRAVLPSCRWWGENSRPVHLQWHCTHKELNVVCLFVCLLISVRTDKVKMSNRHRRLKCVPHTTRAHSHYRVMHRLRLTLSWASMGASCLHSSSAISLPPLSQWTIKAVMPSWGDQGYSDNSVHTWSVCVGITKVFCASLMFYKSSKYACLPCKTAYYQPCLCERWPSILKEALQIDLNIPLSDTGFWLQCWSISLVPPLTCTQKVADSVTHMHRQTKGIFQCTATAHTRVHKSSTFRSDSTIASTSISVALVTFSVSAWVEVLTACRAVIPCSKSEMGC